MPRNSVFVNKDVWAGVDAKNQAAIGGCADMAAYAGLWRAIQYTDFTLKGLRQGGMTVQPAGDGLQAELNEIGKTMAAEWKAAAGAEGAAIVDAFKAQ